MPYADPEKQREYQRKWARRKQREVKLYGIRLLGGECEHCSEDDPSRLEFDHINPSEKRFSPVSGYSKAPKLWYEELFRCQILCDQCHIDKSLDNDEYHPEAEKLREHRERRRA